MKAKALQGGEFLIRETNANDIFIPEEFDEEQLMIAQTCNDFLSAEIYHLTEKIDSHEDLSLMPGVMKKAGELGILGVSIPEEYGGFGQNFVTSMLASDIMGGGNSFSVAFSAHTGIGSLPILYYGTEEQKQKYLPFLATGEKLGAYCLTEPGAGSDANSGTTKAVLSEDGKHWILNGQKMWITNGGFADVYTVFAKIDNDRVLSAFIVERGYEGLSLGAEEHKMGIKGSSTVQVFFNDCKVPVENLLGKRGEGFRIALNILNLGRIKLGANVIGASKRVITTSVNYANERKQFRALLSTFPAIKFKLAEQVIRAFANESTVYRISKNIEDSVEMYINEGLDKGTASVDAQRDFAIEAALIKVYGSEMLDYVVDEGVQIHGGMGYSAETDIETMYRDSRINRIFEGTNEINRMVVSDTMIKKGMKKAIALLPAAEEVWKEMANLPSKPAFSSDYHERNQQYIKNFKKATLMVTKLAIDKLGQKIAGEQEILFNLADMMMQLYVAESAALRVEKMDKNFNKHNISVYKDILDALQYESGQIIYKAGLDAITYLEPEETQSEFINALLHFTSVKPVNLVQARRNIADKLIDDNKYNFSTY
ncbi:MAG: acyl-CoA dehydrogenase family protein [Bacteroidales bacterium]|nr:acyl-CoA dehydrogenase family protein [Bacteroidales bacterium]